MNRPRTAGHPGSLPPSLTTSSEGNTKTDRHITANQADIYDCHPYLRLRLHRSLVWRWWWWWWWWSFSLPHTLTLIHSIVHSLNHTLIHWLTHTLINMTRRIMTPQALHDVYTYHQTQCLMIPINTHSAWRYLSKHALHDNIYLQVGNMMTPIHTCTAWWYLAPKALHGNIYHHMQTLHNDTWSSHALHHDTIPHMHCMMIPYITLHDDSFHCMQCMMKSSNPCIAIRNHTTPALHINTYSSWW